VVTSTLEVALAPSAVLLASRCPTPVKEIDTAPLRSVPAKVTSTVFAPTAGSSKYQSSEVATFPGSVEAILSIFVRATELYVIPVTATSDLTPTPTTSNLSSPLVV